MAYIAKIGSSQWPASGSTINVYHTGTTSGVSGLTTLDGDSLSNPFTVSGAYATSGNTYWGFSTPEMDQVDVYWNEGSKYLVEKAVVKIPDTPEEVGAAASGHEHTQYHLVSDIDDTPVSGETSASISSNWAYEHSNASADVHGIVSVSALATSASVSGAIETHREDTTDVHGISNTDNLATSATVSASIESHRVDEADVHGISATSGLAYTSDVDSSISSAVSTHNAEEENIHGISATSGLAYTVDVDNSISASITAHETSFTHSDIALNTTHRSSDGKDHSDVVLNNAHRTSDGSSHSAVTANTAAHSLLQSDGAVRTGITAISSGATCTIDWSTGSFVYSFTATEDFSLALSNLPSGAWGVILSLTSGGSYTMSYPSGWMEAGGEALSLSTSGVDRLALTGEGTDANTVIISVVSEDIK